jgi:hypothetical protein
MASRKLYDLAVKTGEYTDSQGQQKGRWQNVGAVMSSDNGGQFVMLAKWFNPAGVVDARGGESILLSCFEPGGNNNQQQQPARQAAPSRAPAKPADFDDPDIPF